MAKLENLKKYLYQIRESSSFIATEDGLLKFAEEDSEMLFESVVNLSGDIQKERLRAAIKESFELGPKDLVIFRQNEIFIKRWGGEPLIHPQLVNKIKEAIKKESYCKNSPVIINDCITIQTEALFAELGISPTSLSQDSKDIIKQKIKEQMNLSDKDLVLFLNDKVVVRRFRSNEEVGENFKREQRYNGLPLEELRVLKESLFESSEVEQEILSDITDTILGYELNFKSITHDYFTKNYIKIFQRNILKFLKDNLSNEEMVLEGLSNLLLRENWVLIHTKMAIKLLSLVSEKNPNAENFLKNYSGEIEIDNERNKFKLPEILDKNGSKWTIPSIIGIVMQRKKMLEAIALKQKGIDDIKNSIEAMYGKIDEINAEAIQIEKELAVINMEGSDRVSIETSINAEIKELREMLKRCKEEDKKKIQAEISDKMLYLKKLVIKEDGLFTRKKRLEHQGKLITAKLEKINFDIAKMQKKVREEEEKLSQFISSQKSIDEKFDSLTEALTMALMRRKTRV